MTAGAILVLLLAADAGAPKAPPDCDASYYGEGRPRDFNRALACYRSEQNWLMVAIMQLNGEGTAVDVAGARKSLAHVPQNEWYGDELQLDEIIKKREAAPTAQVSHVDFCDDVAGTTPTLNWCQSRSLERDKHSKDVRLKQLRARIEPVARPSFDRLVATLDPFAKAESSRAYQVNIEGTIRGAAAMDQEKVVRDHFTAIAKALTDALERPPSAPRSFTVADAELNAVHRDNVRSRVSDWEKEASEAGEKDRADTYRQYASEYRNLARAAQHEWLRYREAAAKLAATRWPKVTGVEDVVRALVTEDRIQELRDEGK